MPVRRGRRKVAARRPRRYRVAYARYRNRRARLYRGRVGRYPNPVFRYVRTSPIVDSMNGQSLTLYDGNIQHQELDFTLGDDGMMELSIPSSGITAGVSQWAAMTFHPQLRDVVNVTEFSSLYDQFKIIGAKLIIRPMANFAQPSIAAEYEVNSSQMWLHSVFDPDDGTITGDIDETQLNTFVQYHSYKCKTLWARNNKPYVSYYLRPKVNGALSQGGGTYNMKSKSRWLDIGSADDVDHYGFKFLFQFIPAKDNQEQRFLFHVSIKYYLAFKTVR